MLHRVVVMNAALSCVQTIPERLKTLDVAVDVLPLMCLSVIMFVHGYQTRLTPRSSGDDWKMQRRETSRVDPRSTRE